MNRIGFFTIALGAAVVALAFASTASAQSAAELLEQGIYTEETVATSMPLSGSTTGSSSTPTPTADLIPSSRINWRGHTFHSIQRMTA